jgi:hypothetical protein
MTPEDLPPAWHLQASFLLFGALAYSVGGRALDVATAGGALGVVLFLLRYVDAQRKLLRAMHERLEQVEALSGGTPAQRPVG